MSLMTMQQTCDGGSSSIPVSNALLGPQSAFVVNKILGTLCEDTVTLVVGRGHEMLMANAVQPKRSASPTFAKLLFRNITACKTASKSPTVYRVATLLICWILRVVDAGDLTNGLVIASEPVFSSTKDRRYTFKLKEPHYDVHTTNTVTALQCWPNVRRFIRACR